MGSFRQFHSLFRSRLRRRADADAAAVGGPAQSRLSGLEQKKRPIVRTAIGFMVAIGVLMCALEAWTRADAYGTQLGEGEVAAANTARAAADHAGATIDLAAAILADLVERVETDGLGKASYARLHNHLMMRVAQTQALQGLLIYDQTGRWAVTSLATADTTSNNADRAYFQYHLTHADREVRVGAPILSRSAGVWVLPISRRLQHADGSFAGVALATVRIAYFQRYYDGFDLGRKGALLLALTDGTLVTRRPFVEANIGSNIAAGPVFAMINSGAPSGSAMRVSRIDGVERLFSYRKLDGYPLVVAAALSREEIFAPWWQDTWHEAGALAVMLAILAGGGVRLLRQVRIRDRMELEMRRLQTQLRGTVTELDRLVNTDALTGLKNRRCLSDQLDIEFARAARERSSLALVMIDIDHFKRYNDLYGHPGGDGCLRLVSDIIGQVSQRPGDLTARFGGEEFAVLLPNTDLAGAMAVAAKLCDAVAATRAPHAASERGIVTISAGAFALLPDGSTSPADLLEAADRGLYAAKSAGRGRARVGSRPPPARPVGHLRRVS